jgi:hypothetical protein
MLDSVSCDQLKVLELAHYPSCRSSRQGEDSLEDFYWPIPDVADFCSCAECQKTIH